MQTDTDRDGQTETNKQRRIETDRQRKKETDTLKQTKQPQPQPTHTKSPWKIVEATIFWRRYEDEDEDVMVQMREDREDKENARKGKTTG